MVSRTSRSLYADGLEALLKGEMAKAVLSRDFELLAEIARLAQQDAPLSLAATDPALFASWRGAVTRFHLAGWTNMTPERVSQVSEIYSDTNGFPHSSHERPPDSRS
ncbi:MAG: hypothetical protein ACRERU_08875 [Methylococcales bacterium]